MEKIKVKKKRIRNYIQLGYIHKVLMENVHSNCGKYNRPLGTF